MNTRLFFLLALLMSIFSVSAQFGGVANIEFTTLTHDFGTIPQDKKTTYTFSFKNTGKGPLLLSDVKSSCGCTIPAWTQEPIMPGQSSTLKVEYDAKSVGEFEKKIAVSSNAEEGDIILTIKGIVSANAVPKTSTTVTPATKAAPVKPAAKPAAKKPTQKKPSPTTVKKK